MASWHQDFSYIESVKVLHVSTVHHAADVRIRLKECATLAGAGHQVTLLARRDAGDAMLDESLVDLGDGVKTVFLEKVGRSRVSRALAQREVLGYIRRTKPDIVHFHDPELLPALASCSRILKYHAIYDVHENLREQLVSKPWIANFLRAPISKIIGFLEPAFARLCGAVVIVDSDWSAHFTKSKTVVLRNVPLASDYDGFVSPDMSDVDPHFLYVGTMMPERGCDWLVRAAQQMPAFYEMTVAGPARNPAYLEHVQQLDENRRVDFPGWVDRVQALKLMERSLAGLVPLQPISNYDVAIATKLFEYAHAGLPMILSSTTMHRKLVDEHGFGLLVDFNDAEQLLEAMQLLVDDRELAAAMAKRSLAFAQEYSWEVESEDLLSHYAAAGSV